MAQTIIKYICCTFGQCSIFRYSVVKAGPHFCNQLFIPRYCSFGVNKMLFTGKTYSYYLSFLNIFWIFLLDLQAKSIRKRDICSMGPKCGIMTSRSRSWPQGRTKPQNLFPSTLFLNFLFIFFFSEWWLKEPNRTTNKNRAYL